MRTNLKLAPEKSVHDRIEARKESALEAIRLSHEKEAYSPSEPFECLLPVDAILERSAPAYALNVSEELPFLRRLLRRLRGMK